MKSTNVYKAKISAQGQVTIPSEVRQKIGASKGSYIRFVVTDTNELAITSKLPIEKYFGKTNVLNGEEPVVAMRELRDHSARRLAP